MHNNYLIRTTLLAIACAVSLTVVAQADEVKRIDIPPGDLVTALDALARQSGAEFIYRADQLKGLRSKGIQGTLSAEAALHRMLEGSGFTTQRDPSGAIVIVKDSASAQPEPPEQPPRAEPDSAETTENESYELEEVIVVGSRLGVTSPGQSAMPIKLVTRDDIDRSGARSIAQVLSYLPEVSISNGGDTNIGPASGFLDGSDINATTVQLRGLPRGTVLILINGRRSGESASFTDTGQFDLSTIPLSMVERIEVLPAGASAVYGGDGLAGVINIVLRHDASGFETRVRQDRADGYVQSQASVMWGKAWSRGSLTATAAWRKNGTLSSVERSLTADQDFTRFGGNDRRFSVSNPAIVYSLEGCPPPPSLCFIPLNQRANLPGLDAPFATVPAGQDGEGLTPADFADTAGVQNHASSKLNFFSPEENYSLGLNGRIAATSAVELFAELTYSRRDLPARENMVAMQLGQSALFGSRVPASNPFNPFGVEVAVDYQYEHTGLFTDYTQSYLRTVLGGRGQLGRWEWELSGWWSRDQAELGGVAGVIAFEKVDQALRSTDPDTALNPFVGDGGPPGSPELLASLISPLDRNYSSELLGVTGFVRGPLVELPTGEVLGLVGGEHQKRTLDRNQEISGDNTNHAVFAELRVPVWAGTTPGATERLALTGAFRRESIGHFEDDATTETLGLEFKPLSSLLLRATYSTAFKPLPDFNLVQDPRPFSNYLVPDPRFGGEVFPVELTEGGGAPPGLQPETSTSRTAGILYFPASGWQIAATYWDNRLRNRFFTPWAGFLVEHEDLFGDRVVRDPESGILVRLDVRPVNITATDVAGVDLSIDGRWSTPYGDIVPAISATYIHKYEEQIAPTSPVEDNVSVWRSAGWAPRWKVVPRIGWSYQDVAYATLTGRYVSSYEDPSPLTTGDNAGEYLTLGDFWLVDLNMDLSFGRWLPTDSTLLSGARLNIGVTNMFDSLPEFCNSCGTAGYDASQYDIRGRTIYAELRFGL